MARKEATTQAVSQKGDWGQRGREEEDRLQDVLFMYAGGQRLNDVGDLHLCVNCEFAWLPNNLLTILSPLASLRGLRLLDVQSNMIQYLPDESFWRCLESLQILFLHNNRIGKTAAYAGLGGSPRLRCLTMHNNPVAQSPFFRALTVSMCPALLTLDNAVVGDDDFLPPTHMLYPSLIQRRQAGGGFKMPPIWEVDARSDYNTHALAHLQQSMSAHRGFSMLRPSVLIQRVFRGHKQRQVYRRFRGRIQPATAVIQSWLRKCFFRRKVRTEYRQLAHSGLEHIQRALCALPAQEAPLLPASDHSIYFFPHDVVRLECLLRAYAVLNPGRNRQPTLSLCTYVVLPIAGRKHKGVSPFPIGTLARRMHPYRSGAQLCKLVRIKSFPSLLQVVGFAIVRRHGHHVNSQEKAAFWKGQTDGLEGGQAIRTGRSRMMQLSFTSEQGVRSFLRLVHCANAHTDLVDDDGSRLIMRFVLPSVAARLASVSSAQGAIRACIMRMRMVPALGTAVLAVRSVRVMQRWWRWRLVNLRLSFLINLRRRIQTVTDSTLYCVAKRLEENLMAATRRGSVLREAKTRFGYNQDGNVFFTPPTPSPLTPRGHLPLWLEFDIPISSEDSAYSAVDLQGHKDLFSLIGVDTRTTLMDSRTGKLPGKGGGVIPRRQLTGSDSITQISFSSAAEARKRMTLLMIYTWTPCKRQPVVLMNPLEARQHLSAILMQSVYRGWKARQWFKPLKKFLHSHLQTTIFMEKEKAWATRGGTSDMKYAPHVFVEGEGGGGGGRDETRAGVQVSLWQYENSREESGTGLCSHEESGTRLDTRMHTSTHADAGVRPGTTAPVRMQSSPPKTAGISQDGGREKTDDGHVGGHVVTPSGFVGKLDIQYVLALQTDRLRLAGLKPAGGVYRPDTGDYRQNMAEAVKWELEVDGAAVKGNKALKLQEQRKKNQVARDTQVLTAALRNRRETFSLRAIERTQTQLKEQKLFEDMQELRAKTRLQRENHAEAMEIAQMIRQEVVERAQKDWFKGSAEAYAKLLLQARASNDPDALAEAAALLEGAQPIGPVQSQQPRLRSVSASAKARAMRAVKQEEKNWEKRFQGATNMIGYHIHRAEMDKLIYSEKRINQVRVQTARGIQYHALSETRSKMEDLAAKRTGESKKEKEQRLATAFVRRRTPNVKYEGFWKKNSSGLEAVRLGMEGMNYPIGRRLPSEISGPSLDGAWSVTTERVDLGPRPYTATSNRSGTSVLRSTN